MSIGGKPWVVVLAGGSGTRLHAIISTASGKPVPKQFCRLDGQDSMIGITLARAQSITNPERIAAMVLEEHRGWWEDELSGIDSKNIIPQSHNRGTGFALLVALLHINEVDPDATVIVMPSDHMVDEETILRHSILEAFETARRDPCRSVLIGVPADRPDPALGWIRAGCVRTRRTLDVIEFVEKPSLTSPARRLYGRGYLNTMILAGTSRTLRSIYARVLPDWLRSLGIDADSTRIDVRSLAGIHTVVPSIDISHDLLPQAAAWLRVLPLPECGWTDIGTTARLQTWWTNHPLALDRVRRCGVM